MSCFYTELHFRVVNGGVYENISSRWNWKWNWRERVSMTCWSKF